MNSVLYFVLAIALMNGIHGRAIDELDNSIEQDDKRPFGEADWVTIVESPPLKLIQHIGDSIELECEVAGIPPPTIHWVRGNKPHSTFNDYESNLISENNPRSFVRVRSRLIIDHVVPTEKSFTCIGRSGSKTAFATTTVYSKPSNTITPYNLTELLSLNSNVISGPKKARIVLYYTTVIDVIGSNVVLPCKAAGRPHPEIYWLDANKNIINDQDPRIRVLPTNELLIRSLKWEDMGPYTCIARNLLAKDSATTFVYPMANVE